MNKRWQIELRWIVILLCIALLVDFLLFGKLSVFQSTIDVQLHSTYFVLPGFLWFLSLFIILTAPVYLIKETRWRFRRFAPNLIVTILLLLLLSLVFYWHNVTHSMLGGWRVYPPLSAEAMQDFSPPSFQPWNITFISIEVLLILGLILFIHRTNKLAS